MIGKNVAHLFKKKKKVFPRIRINYRWHQVLECIGRKQNVFFVPWAGRWEAVGRVGCGRGRRAAAEGLGQ